MAQRLPNDLYARPSEAAGAIREFVARRIPGAWPPEQRREARESGGYVVGRLHDEWIRAGRPGDFHDFADRWFLRRLIDAMRSGDPFQHDREGFHPERQPDSLNRPIGEDGSELGETLASPAPPETRFNAILRGSDLEKLNRVLSEVREASSFYGKRKALGEGTPVATTVVWDAEAVLRARKRKDS